MSAFVFFFQAEDGIRDGRVTGVQTCALPIWRGISTTNLVMIPVAVRPHASDATFPRPLHAAADSTTGRQSLQTIDRKSTRLNSSHPSISYAVFCLKKKNNHSIVRNNNKLTTT